MEEGDGEEREREREREREALQRERERELRSFSSLLSLLREGEKRETSVFSFFLTLLECEIYSTLMSLVCVCSSLKNEEEEEGKTEWKKNFVEQKKKENERKKREKKRGEGPQSDNSTHADYSPAISLIAFILNTSARGIKITTLDSRANQNRVASVF